MQQQHTILVVDDWNDRPRFLCVSGLCPKRGNVVPVRPLVEVRLLACCPTALAVLACFRADFCTSMQLDEGRV